MTSRITEADLTIRTSPAFDLCVALGYVTPAEWPDWERRRKAAIARGELVQLGHGVQRITMDFHTVTSRAVSNDKPVSTRQTA